MSAGFVEDHTTETVGQYHGHLSSFHVVGAEHGAGALADFSSAGFHVPGKEIIGAISAAVATTHAGAMVTICRQHG